ncbi:MAG TPA: serine/threonine-protein kinase [Gemmataceae bacterium]|nr:serine/threonine-protein kinase [Gemmataceae bacterium]
MDRPTFFRLLERSRLLSKRRVAKLIARVPDESAEEIAKTLVAQGWLTRFQARQLLTGHSSGLVLGPYRLLKQIGIGSVGVVYKAFHEVMGRVVALKVVRQATQLSDSNGHQLFRREVRAASRLNHPNIVAVYDAARAKGVDYLAMEYVKGMDLRNYVAERGPIGTGMACELMRQAAEALLYSQSRGLVHCDIKPSNLLLRKTPRWKFVPARAPGESPVLVMTAAPMLKILDFGLAQVRGKKLLPTGADLMETAEPGSVWGTLDFMSPEQFADPRDVDVRSDLYSLGCTFYYGLTGQVPFPGTTETEKLVHHATGQPIPVNELRPEIPAPVSQIIARLMAKSRDDRFATPAELAHELVPWCIEEKIPAPSPASSDSSLWRTVSDLDLDAASQTETGDKRRSRNGVAGSDQLDAPSPMSDLR